MNAYCHGNHSCEVGMIGVDVNVDDGFGEFLCKYPGREKSDYKSGCKKFHVMGLLWCFVEACADG